MAEIITAAEARSIAQTADEAFKKTVADIFGQIKTAAGKGRFTLIVEGGREAYYDLIGDTFRPLGYGVSCSHYDDENGEYGAIIIEWLKLPF